MIKNTFKNILCLILFPFFLLVLTSCEQEEKQDNKPHVKLSPSGYTHPIKKDYPTDADDIAIWINKMEPKKSLIFGNDKKNQGGIYAWDLNGKEISFQSLPRVINLDIRQNIMLEGMQKPEDLLVTADRLNNQIHIYSIHPEGHLVKKNANTPISSQFNKQTYGLGLYHDIETNKLYVFVSSKKDQEDIHQFELFVNKANEIDGRLVRKIPGSQLGGFAEGIAADDENKVVFIADEDHGILKIQANPDSSPKALSIFGKDQLSKDRKGIALWKCPYNNGFLLVSNQGSSNIKVFDRISQAYLGTIENLGSKHSDGIEVTSEFLGEKYPQGLLVAHNEDDTNFALYNLEDLKGSIFQCPKSSNA